MGKAWREQMDAGMSSNFQSPYLPIPLARFLVDVIADDGDEFAFVVRLKDFENDRVRRAGQASY
ncbi:MAG: hypothetical protein OXH00_20225 [Candidatus Poribacteria bacterium]|nr:hypothetical protein [Candidatus Poribacteria bacterium]